MTLLERVQSLRAIMQKRVQEALERRSYDREAAERRDLCDAVLEEMGQNV